MGCAECLGGAMINGLLVEVGFSRCEEFPDKDNESVVTGLGVFKCPL